MELLTPLGLAALGLVPPLVLLYFLKLKRVPVEISSSLLWAKALLDARANAPFQRLRRNLLLLLQILMLILIAFALARPAVTVKGRATRATVIVIDGSASMASRDVKPSRFEKAKELATDAVNDLGPADEAMVVWAGPRPRVAASFGRDKNVLGDAIDALTPADAPSDLRSALSLALSASEGRGSREIVLLSDGAFDPVGELPLGDVPLRFVKVGEKGANLALVAVDVRRRAGGGRQGFATVANFGDVEETVDLEIKLRPDDGKGGDLPAELISLEPIVVPAGGERSEVFVVPDEGGLVEITISPGGALAADDRVFVAVPSQGKISVGVAGSDAILVRRGLQADPRFRMRPDMSGAESAKLDAAVFVKEPAPSLEQGRYLLIAPPSGSGLFSVGAAVENPGRIHWEPQHDITRFTGLGDAHVGEAIATTPPPGAVVLAEAGAIPIVWAYERPRLRMVVMAFDPFASDFPLRAGFPIFLGNAVDWLIAGRGTGPRVVGAGEIARGDVEEDVDAVTVTAPDGRKSEVPVREGEWIYDGTTRAGVYEVAAGKKGFRFAVNLLSRAESDVRPRTTLEFGVAKVAAETDERVARRREIWPWLAVFAVGMLVTEWWYFHKRGG